MSLHIDIGRPDRVAVVEAKGTCDDIAAELAAVASLIYVQFCKTGTSAGADFRESLIAMTREDADVWAVANTTLKGGYGQCIIYDPSGRDKPMKPRYEKEPYQKHMLADVPAPVCPVCGRDLLDEANDGYDFCPECGQRIDWGTST